MSARKREKPDRLAPARDRLGAPPTASETRQRLLAVLERPSASDACAFAPGTWQPPPRVPKPAPEPEPAAVDLPAEMDETDREPIARGSDEDASESSASTAASDSGFDEDAFAAQLAVLPQTDHEARLLTWGPDPGTASAPEPEPAPPVPAPTVSLAAMLEPLVDTLTEHRDQTVDGLAGCDPDLLEMAGIALDPMPITAIALDDVGSAFDLLVSNGNEVTRLARALNAKLEGAANETRAATERERALAGELAGRAAELATRTAERDARTEQFRAASEQAAEATARADGLVSSLSAVRVERDALAAETRAQREAIARLRTQVAAGNGAERQTDAGERALAERVRSVARELADAALDIPQRYRALYDRFVAAKRSFYDARSRRAAVVKRVLDHERLAVELDDARGLISSRRGIAPAELAERYERLVWRTVEAKDEYDSGVRDSEQTLEAVMAIQSEYRQLSERTDAVRGRLAQVTLLCDVFALPLDLEIREHLADAERRMLANEHTRSVTTFVEQVPSPPAVLTRLFEAIPSHRAFLVSLRGFTAEGLFMDRVSRRDAIGRLLLIAYRVLVSEERGRSVKTVTQILRAGTFIREEEVETAQKIGDRIKPMFEVTKFRIFWVWKPTENSRNAGDEMLRACHDPVAVAELLRLAQSAYHESKRATANAGDPEEDPEP